MEIDKAYPASHPIVFWFFSGTSSVNEPFLESLIVNMLIERLLEYINKRISQILIVQETFKHV